MSTPKIIISQSIKSRINVRAAHSEICCRHTLTQRLEQKTPSIEDLFFDFVKGKLNEHKCTFQSKGRIMETSSVLAISFKYIIIMALFLVIFLFIYCVVLTL